MESSSKQSNNEPCRVDARRQAECHFCRALDLIANGNEAGAISEYEAAVRIDPTFTDPMHGLVRLLQDSGRLDDAIAMAKRLIQSDSDDILAHTGLSILYQRKGMVADAEAEANKARILGWKKELKSTAKS